MMIFMIRTKKIKTVIWKNVTQSGYDEAIKLRERGREYREQQLISIFNKCYWTKRASMK